MKAVRELINRKYYKYFSMTFTSSNDFHSFTVPSTTTKLIVDCVASKGAGAKGGKGGRVQCTLPVTPSSTLYFYIGGVPSTTDIAEYNASDIRTNNAGVLDTTSLSSRLIVAGGGGGSASGSNYTGGSGGGLIGGIGESHNSSYGGTGGTQSTGGEGSTSAYNGVFGIGGNAALSSSGAGGGGWYGGGGGGSDSTLYTHQGAGGGGSSYTDSSCTYITHTRGYNAGTGYIKITYVAQSTPYDYDFYTDEALYKAKNVAFNNAPVYYMPISMNAGRYVNPIKLTGYTVVGNLTIVDGVVSGFSASDYLDSSIIFPNSLALNSSETQIKFTTLNDTSFYGKTLIYTPYTGNTDGLWIGSRGVLGAFIGGENNRVTSNLTLQPNTTYIVKLVVGSDTISIYAGTSIDNLQLVASKEKTLFTPTVNHKVFIGCRLSGASAFTGSIDLNETYIKINDVYWFRGDLHYGTQSIE